MIKFKKNSEECPWFNFYGDVPKSLKYPNGSMVDLIAETAFKYPNNNALTFYNNKLKYKEFLEKIEECARSLKAIGVKEDDVVSICMPNTIEALTMFYAINMVGAIANMIHPLSSEKEIELYLNKSKSSVIFSIDINYKKVINIINNTNVSKIIIGSAGDDLKGLKKTAYKLFNTDLTKAIKKLNEVFLKAFNNREVLSYKRFIIKGHDYHGEYWVPRKDKDKAVILYSGGTSGTPKGIMLSNLNFNALAMEAHLMCDPAKEGDSILAIMPIFHGFGLGVCIHTTLYIGMDVILIPTFKANTLYKIIKEYKPNFFVGVPTLFEALVKTDKFKDDDLSSIHTIVSGGDVMDEENYERYNEFFHKYGSPASIRIGYGLTEATAATCLSPRGMHKKNSIGIPFPDCFYKIVKPGTTHEVKTGTDGEICISGPTVMVEYINEKEETAKTLQKHKDGKLWLHTGDIGCIDKDGFVYFKSRLKRIIITSGYNVYPSYIENIINKHEYVSSSSVIGVPDKYKGEVVKAFIVLKKEVKPCEEVEKSIKEHCEKFIAKYSMPKIFEFKKELPKTLIGKIAYSVLEDENGINGKLKQGKEKISKKKKS